MVKSLIIGIIGAQGAVSEHYNSIKKSFIDLGIKGDILIIKDKNEIEKIDGLIIPGGESTTISRILYKNNLFKTIIDRYKKDNLPIMGTCAGCVILSKEVEDDKNLKLLKIMNISVKRNAFGRQKESFEKEISINVFNKNYNAVFIRAPLIKKVWDKCSILSKIDDKIIMVKQDNLLAVAFHPELTDDLRVHKYFLNMIL